MSPIVALRFQDPDGWGPFMLNDQRRTPPFGGARWQSNCLDMADMPIPYDITWTKEHRFAFPGPELIRKWVTTADQIQLANRGFTLKAFLVPPGCFLWSERDQIAFEAAKALEVEPFE
jgi:hypothetical protein